MNEFIFTITNKLLLCHIVIDSGLQSIQIAIDSQNFEPRYLYFFLIFNSLMIIINYKFLIHNQYAADKRDYFCLAFYFLEILGQTYLNIISNYSHERFFFTGMQRILFLMIVELNIHNFKKRRIFLIVENAITLFILCLRFTEYDIKRIIVPLTQNFIITLWLIVFNYYYEAKIIEKSRASEMIVKDRSGFTFQKSNEVVVQLVQNMNLSSRQLQDSTIKRDDLECSNFMGINQNEDLVRKKNPTDKTLSKNREKIQQLEKVASFNEYQDRIQQEEKIHAVQEDYLNGQEISAQRVFESCISPSINVISNEQVLIQPLSNNSIEKPKSFSALLKHEDNVLLTLKSRSNSRFKFFEEIQQFSSKVQQNSSYFLPSTQEIPNSAYFQNLFHQNTQQGMCCFTQHYELVYYNTQLATILGTNDNRENIKDEILKILTVQVCEDLVLNESLQQPQTNDFHDFEQIIKLSKKFNQEQSYRSGSNQNSKKFNNSYLIRDKIFEQKKNHYKSRQFNGSQEQVQQDSVVTSQRIFPNGYTSYCNDEIRSSGLLSNSYLYSLTQRTQMQMLRNITFIQILECLFLLLDIKLQIWEELGHQSPNKNIKQLDFNLIVSFAKDNRILEIKMTNLQQANFNFFFMEINDVTTHYLLRLTKVQTDALNWQKNYNSSCIKNFINGVIPLVEIGLKSKTKSESNIFLEKIYSFYNTYCLNLNEGEFQNFMPKKYGFQTIQQFELITLCEDLKKDITNILKSIDIEFIIKKCDTPVIRSDPNKIRIILWNIIQIMNKLFTEPLIKINLNQQDNLNLFTIDGMGSLQDEQILEFLKKNSDTNHTLYVSRTLTGTLKEKRFSFIVQKCQSIALELSLYQQDLQVSNLIANDKTQCQVQIRFVVTNQNPDLSEIHVSFLNFHQYRVSSKLQISPKFDHYGYTNSSERKIMVYDSNGFQRFSLQQQLDFLIIKYKFVFTSNNLKQEINKEIENIGLNPYSIIMIIIDPFDDFNYKELNFELKDEFQVKTLAISWRKMEKEEFERLGFDESLENPILLNDLYRIWSQYMQVQEEDCLKNPSSYQ